MARETVTIAVRVKDLASDALQGINRQLDRGAGAADVFSGNLKADLLLGFANAAGEAASALARYAAQGVASAVQANAELEQSIQDAVALSGGAFEDLESAAVEAGMAAAFSAREAGDALGFLAQAGFSASEATGALPGVLDLASAGTLELGAAADIASNALSGFSLRVDELGRVNDVLAQTAASSNTNVSQLGQALKNVAPLATSSGQSIESVSSAIGVLGNAGIQGGEAGTALRSALSALQKPSGEAGAVIEQLGVQVNDAEGQMRPMVDVIEDFGKAGATNADLITVFGREAVASVSALSASTDEWREATRRATEESEGFAKSIADQKLDTLSGQYQILTGSVETYSARLGGALNPALLESSKAINEVLAEGDLLSEELADLERMVFANQDAFSDFALGSLALTVAGVKSLVDALQGFGSIASSVMSPIDSIGETLGLVSTEAESLEDKVGDAAAAIDTAGKVFFSAMTAVLPPLGILGNIGLEFANLEENAREVARSIETIDDTRRLQRVAEDARELDDIFGSFTDTLAAYPTQIFEGVRATVEARIEEERLAEVRRRNSRIALEADIRAAKAGNELSKLRAQRAAAVARVRAQGLDAQTEALKIERTRAQFASQIAAAAEKQRKANERSRKEAEAKAKAEREARFELIERNALAEYRLDVLTAQTEQERIQAAFAFEQMRIDTQDLTELERKVALKEAEIARDQQLRDLGNEQLELAKERRREREAEAEAARQLNDNMALTVEALSNLSTGMGEVDAIAGSFRDVAAATADTRDAQRAYAAAQQAVAAGAVDAKQQELAATQQVTEAEMARASAIQASGDSAAAAAGALGASAQAEAAIQAAFNTAAAASAFASLYFTGNPAFGIAGAQYLVSAGLFGAVAAGAGGSGGSASVPSGGSGGVPSGAGGGLGSPGGMTGSSDLARMQAEALADVLDERAGGDINVTLDLRGAVTSGEDELARQMDTLFRNNSRFRRLVRTGGS